MSLQLHLQISRLEDPSPACRKLSEMNLTWKYANSWNLKKWKIDYETGTRTRISERISHISNIFYAFSQQKATYQQPSKQRKGWKIKHCDCHYSNIFLFIKIIAKFCLIKFSKNFPYEKTFVVFLSLWKVKQS